MYICLYNLKHDIMDYKFNYWLYYLVFCPLHFLVYELQPARSDEERDEFMDRFHSNDILD